MTARRLTGRRTQGVGLLLMLLSLGDGLLICAKVGPIYSVTGFQPLADLFPGHGFVSVSCKTACEVVDQVCQLFGAQLRVSRHALIERSLGGADIALYSETDKAGDLFRALPEDV